MRKAKQIEILRIIIVSFSYFLLGKLAFAISVKHGIVTNAPFFAEGVSLSFAILFGNTMALGTFIGQFILAVSGGLDPMLSFGLASINSALSIFGSWLFHRIKISVHLDRLHDYTFLVVLILFAIQPISSLTGNLLLLETKHIATTDFIDSAIAWWLGNSIGQLVLTPFILLAYSIKLKNKVKTILLTDFPFALLVFAFTIGLFALTNYIPESYKFSILLSLFPIALFFASKRKPLGIMFGLFLMTIAAFYTSSHNINSLFEGGKIDNFVKLDLLIIGLQVSVMFVVLMIDNLEVTKLELKKTLSSLEKSENRLSLALKGSNDGLWDWNVKTNEIYFSPSWKSMLGYEDSEIENNVSTLERLVHPEDIPSVRQYILDFLDRKHPHYELEYRMVHKDGESVKILSRAQHQYDEETGDLTRLVGTHVNITNIKKTEEQIRKLSTAVEQNPASIVITDIDGKIEYVNKKFTELSGYSLEETIGQNPSILKSGKTDENSFKELWETLTKGRIWKGEFINKNKYGKEYIESAVISPVFDGNNKIMSYIAIKEDITERKQTELVLKEKDEKYKLITDNITDVIWVINIDRQRFTYISPSVSKLTGFTVEELMPLNIFHSIFSFDPLEVRIELQKRLKHFKENQNDDNVFIDQLQMYCKNGDLIWVENSTKFRYDAWGEVEMSCVSRNIENRKRMEAEILVQNRKLIDLNATKDKFFNIIAHDLRNPFNGILMSSGVLSENIYKYPTETIKEVVELINESAKNAYSLLENLLVWARSQTGRIDYHPTKVSLKKLFEEVFRLVDGLAKHKMIKLISDVEGDVFIQADKNMITTALRNIVTNAIKFTHKNGTVTICGGIRGQIVEIYVADTGIGISEVGLQKLFLINEKISTLGTENETGTGLGLLLCKEFIEKHGGEISVESELGKGTIFRIKLPNI